MDWRFLTLLTAGLSLSAAVFGQVPAGRIPLHNLSAGTKLRVREPILIRANNESEPLSSSSGGVGGTICRIRMKGPEPFDRVISPDRELVVRDVKRAGFSAPHRIQSTTYVELDSKSVDDIMCLAANGAREPTIGDFQNAIGGRIALEAPERGPREVD